METGMAHISIAVTYKVTSGLSIGIFTFDLRPFLRSSQDHAHFDCEYVVNDGRYGKHHFVIAENRARAFDCHICIRP